MPRSRCGWSPLFVPEIPKQAAIVADYGVQVPLGMARAAVHVNYSDRPITPDPDDRATSLSYA
jgi:hypothetical protein